MAFSMLIFWAAALSTLYIGTGVARLIYNLYLHPLRRFPGPRAAAATAWWKCYVEVVRGESFVHLLVELHKRYPGGVVRVGPNELHFSTPEAYNTIYNTNNRWDKEKLLYESFGEDHSSFGLLNYHDAKERKDVLQPLFSRRTIVGVQDLVSRNVDTLISVLSHNARNNKASDLLFAFRCFAIDNITAFCFNNTVDALNAPDFRAPIVTAMDASLLSFPLFHHLPLFRKLILGLPPRWAVAMSPETAGLTELQEILGRQVDDIVRNPEMLKEGQHPTIYHRLLDITLYRSGHLPSTHDLLEEASTMMFAGGVTVGDTLMTAFYHILSNPWLYAQLRLELRRLWPARDQEPPRWEDLERLPLLTATIKESLRMTPGACSPLLRVVPTGGALVDAHVVPAGSVVGSATLFVHQHAGIFPQPERFLPARWLTSEPRDPDLERYLVTFSRGPRSCLGSNLAWCELYLVMSSCLRLLEMRVDGVVGREEVRENEEGEGEGEGEGQGGGSGGLVWRDCFTPFYEGRHLHVQCRVVED